MDGFRHVWPMAVRFRDVDAMGHVNNAVYFTYLETARVEYMRRVAFESPFRQLSEAPLILARISCEFKQPITYGQSVEVGTRVREMRTSSFLIEQHIYADGQLAAVSEGVVVHYDYRAGSSTPIPDQVRARVQAFEGQSDPA